MYCWAHYSNWMPLYFALTSLFHITQNGCLLTLVKKHLLHVSWVGALTIQFLPSWWFTVSLFHPNHQPFSVTWDGVILKLVVLLYLNRKSIVQLKWYVLIMIFWNVNLFLIKKSVLFSQFDHIYYWTLQILGIHKYTGFSEQVCYINRTDSLSIHVLKISNCTTSTQHCTKWRDDAIAPSGDNVRDLL